MPAGFDVADNRTQIWLPVRLNPANRLNRGLHVFYAIGRLKNGVTARMAEAELNELMSNWGERVGLSSSSHVFRLTPPGPHVLQMKPLQDEIVGSAETFDLGLAGRRRVRVTHCLRESCEFAARPCRDTSP